MTRTWKAILFLLLFMLVGGGAFVLSRRLENGGDRSSVPKTQMRVGKQELHVELAQTPPELTQGLSGRLQLAPNTGMLFVFSQRLQPTFWMKDMLFDLDFIWIDSGKVVELTQNVRHPVAGTADTQLPRFVPAEPVSGVLEVPSGFVDKHNVHLGDAAYLLLP